MSKGLRWCSQGCGTLGISMKYISGNCHCGAVQFELKSPLDEFTTCDCSLCVMRNAVMLKVPEVDLKIISGEDKLTLYQWNMKMMYQQFE